MDASACTQVAFPLELDDGLGTFDHMYSAFERFHEAFFSDWAVSPHLI